jgi:hypothetical protein
MDFFGKSSQVIQDRITQLENYTPTESDFGPRLDEVIQLQAQVIQQLRMMFTQAKQLESVNSVAQPIEDQVTSQDVHSVQQAQFEQQENNQLQSQDSPLLGGTIKSDVFETSTNTDGYIPLDLWPSAVDRAENDELDRVCDQLEVAESHIAFLEAELNKALAA